MWSYVFVKKIGPTAVPGNLALRVAIFLNAAGVRFAVVCRVLMPGSARRAIVQTTK